MTIAMDARDKRCWTPGCECRSAMVVTVLSMTPPSSDLVRSEQLVCRPCSTGDEDHHACEAWPFGGGSA